MTSSEPIGSIGWTESTGGVLTGRECLSLARPLLRGELSLVAGLLAMALRVHSGRRNAIDPASLKSGKVIRVREHLDPKKALEAVGLAD